jgi:ABC-type proline/glycine betaine transport system ATPase subunit
LVTSARAAAGILYDETAMKNPAEVLRLKQFEIDKIKKEIEALRIAAQLLEEKHAERLPRKTAKIVQLP